jgi:hypothetical protein
MDDMAADNGATGSTGSGKSGNVTYVTRDEMTGVMHHVLKIVGPHFKKAERSRLALVADVSEMIGYADWVVDEIGCPIHQAGLPRASDTELFTQHWDAAIYDLLREHGQSHSQATSPQVLVVR